MYFLFKYDYRFNKLLPCLTQNLKIIIIINIYIYIYIYIIIIIQRVKHLGKETLFIIKQIYV